MPRSRVQAAQQDRALELIAEIERRRRLVEQQQFRRLRKRAGDDDALFLAAAEGANGRDSNDAVPVASSACRAMARSVRPFERERAEMREAAHQHHVEHAEVERSRGLLRDDAIRRARSRRVSCSSGRPVELHAAAGGASMPARICSSVVLPDPFGPRRPTIAPGHRDRHAVDDARSVRR